MGSRILGIVGLVLLALASVAGAQEAPRRIHGGGVDLQMEGDLVFGTVGGLPVWARYRCGRDIQGTMEAAGARMDFAFTYAGKDAPRLVTGSFGGREAALERILPLDQGFVYELSLGEDLLEFRIRYHRDVQGHMQNPVIEGRLPGRRAVRLTVEGQLCPFATSGLILMVAGALTAP
jgi:hypothetical protein